MSIKRLKPGPRMSQAVIHGSTVYLAGQVASDPVPDVKKQTQQILAEIDALLAAAGTDKTKLLSANIWLSDIRTFADMNSVWDGWVSAGNTPARATVEAKLAGPQYLVEIGVIAAI
ncbi:MAG: RidA family protein [Tagaea sp.]|nr:RidA family protein [Tagaea sp.]